MKGFCSQIKLGNTALWFSFVHFSLYYQDRQPITVNDSLDLLQSHHDVTEVGLNSLYYVHEYYMFALILQ